MKRSVVFFLSAAALWILQGCDQQTASNGNGAPLATPPTVTAATKSASFDAVNAHLDLGGVMYGYIDVAGDLDGLLEKIQEIYNEVAAQSNGRMPENLDIKGIVSEIGLNKIAACGLSSVRGPGGKHLNKAYLHSPGGPAGVFRVMGDQAGDLKYRDVAPNDADLVLEQQFELRALKEVFENVMAKVQLPEGAPSAQEMLAQPVPNIDVTIGDILEHSNGRIMVVASIDESVKVPIPDAPIEIPGIDILISLDGMGWLFEKVQGMIPPEGEGPFVREEGDGYVKYSMQVPDQGPFMFYKPVLHYDKAADRLLLASRQAYIDKCTSSDSPKLVAEASFKAAIDGLPQKGNAFSYISGDVARVYKQVVMDAMSQHAGPGGPPIGMMEKAMDMFMGMMEEQAAVTTVEADGIYSVGKASQSMKSALLVAAVYPAAIAAALSGRMVGQRVHVQEMDMAMDAADMAREAGGPGAGNAAENVRQVAMALNLYAVDNDGAFPATLGDLVPDYVADEGLLRVTNQAGEASPLVYFAGLSTGGDQALVVVSTPEADASGQRVVGLSDGTVQTVSETDFLRMARESIEAANQ